MSEARARAREPGWIASLLGAGVLIAGGFALGLVAGVVSEEPELVVGHLVGRSDEVAWLPDAEPGLTPTGGGVADATGQTAPEAIPETRLRDADVIAATPSAPEPAAAPALPPVAAPPPARKAAPSPEAVPARRAKREVRKIESIPATGPSSARAAARKGFAVQVGAFAEGGPADDIRAQLARKGFDTYVVTAAEAGDGKWRVRVGPVPTRGAADRLASRLKTEERLPTWVLSEGGG